MSSIDRRVVEARFDNKQFMSGIKGTLDALSSLKKGLRLDGATKGLSDVDAASKRLSFGGVANSVDNLSNQFGALRIAGIAALSAIATKAAMAGAQMLKSLTLDPVMDGMREYELNLNSIQTILSNTQWEGKNLDDVNGALSQLNEYADKTIYNFAEMAKNIGTFTAAGVELDTSVEAIKGIANLAAISGSSALQASTGMYQLSQALASGTVKLMDWNSVQAAGMGGKVFQDAVIETAKLHGINVDKMIEKEGSFRDTLSEGWFTKEILTDTLAKFTGDLTDAQLKQMGYTDEQIVGIQKMGQSAVDAATKVKSFTQLIDVMKEAVGTGWADTWQIVLGDFEEAKELWTGVATSMGSFIDANSEARNAVLRTWKDLGGRTVLIEALGEAFDSLHDAFEPLMKAFRDFFPSITGEGLYELTVMMRDFFKGFKLGEEVATNLQSTFKGLFSILGIGWEILKNTTGFFRDLFLQISGGAGSVLEMTGRAGEAINKFYEKIKAGDDVGRFFEKIADVVANAASDIASFFGWLETTLGFDFSFEGFSNGLDKLVEAGNTMAAVWAAVAGLVGAVIERVGTVFGKIGSFIMELPAKIADYLSGVDWNLVLSAINTGLFGAFLVLMNNFINNMNSKSLLGSLSELSESFAGAVDGITDSLGAVTGVLGTMQNTLRAATLIQIAAALGIMAWSLTALARIDAADLAKALSAMAGLFVELGAALVGLQFLGGVKGFGSTAIGLTILAGAIKIMVGSVERLAAIPLEDLNRGLAGLAKLLILVVTTSAVMPNPTGLISTGMGLTVLAVAIRLLADSVMVLSDLDWGQMARGLTGIAALLAGLAMFTKLAAANKGGVLQGAGLVMVATAIKILASAAEDFAEMDVVSIVKGLGAISAILGVFTIFSKAVNPSGMVRTGAALVLVSGAMYVLAQATQQFASMDWSNLGRGLVGLAGALAAVGLALALIPPTAVFSATALTIASGGLLALGLALKGMGSMSWDEIGKGLAVLGGALAILAVGLTAMSGTVVGSASLLIAAGALSILTPILFLLGGLEWSAIGKGVVVLAGAFAVLGAAGYLLAPTVPTFIGLATAFLILGGGVALLGVGVNLLAAAFSTLAKVGADVGVVVTELITAMATLIPVISERMADGFITFAETIAGAVDRLLQAVVTILKGLLTAVRGVMPETVQLVGDFIMEMYDKLVEMIPRFAEGALEMMNGILDALLENYPTIVGKMSELITAVLNELTTRVDEFSSAATGFIVAILEAMESHVSKIITAGANIVIAVIEGISSNMQRIIEAGAEAVINFINGVANAIRENMPALRAAGKNLALAIADGMTFGLASKISDVAKGAKDLATGALNSAKKALGIASPSKEFKKLGEWTAEGFAEGLVGGSQGVIAAWEMTTDLLTRAMESSARDVEQLENQLDRLNDAKKKDVEAIKETETALAQARLEYEKTSTALKTVNTDLVDERAELEKLGAQYDVYSEKLDTANQKLEDAIRTRDDYNKQIQNQYSQIPDINEETGLDDFINSLRYANNDAAKFAEVLGKLRDMGITDALYEEFLERGPTILPFLEELLEGGQRSVNIVSNLTSALTVKAKRLGEESSKELHQAGVDAAQGLVDGLESQKAALTKKMNEIAAIVANTIKLQLQIKSPSRVMRALGAFTIEGMVDGMNKSAPAVGKAAANVGSTAFKAMKDSMSNMRDLLDVEVDMNPTIAPVLDLSAFRKDAAKIGTELSAQAVTFDSAYSKAKNASDRYQANAAAHLALVTPNEPQAPSVVNFNQYNNSPKALSAAEIYRQTKNQLSTTKGALTPNVAQEA